MKLLIVLFVGLVSSCIVKVSANKEDPGECNPTKGRKISIVGDRNGNQRVLSCVKYNGKYIWRELDNFPTLGEFFDPAEDCSDIVRRKRDAKNGLYWINGFGKKRSVKKVWCDVTTDGGGFMLIGHKDNPESWSVPSNPSLVSPEGKPHWSSKFGDVPVLEFRVQISTSKKLTDCKADWLYRFTTPRRLNELLMRDKGCTNHYPGIGHIDYVKDLRVGEIVTRNFQCSRFGTASVPGFGWRMMNRCLGTPCKQGFAFFPGTKFRYDSYGAFSYSTNSKRSGVTHNSTAFVGCEHGKCCACFGPKGAKGDFCSTGCQSMNGGTITKKAQIWVWIRSSVPKPPVWKKCAEYYVKNRAGKIETYFIEKSGVARKGSCTTKGIPNLVNGIVEVPNKKALENIPLVEGLLSYRKDSSKVYVTDGKKWEALGKEKQDKALERKLRIEEKNISRIASDLAGWIKKLQMLENRLKKLLNLRVVSEGCNDPGAHGICGLAYIFVDGVDKSKKGRGYNIVTVNGLTGIVEKSVSFDTFASRKEVKKMIKFLSGLSPRTLLIIAIQDEGARMMTSSGYDALVQVGVQNPLKHQYRSSFVYIGWTGPGAKHISQVSHIKFVGSHSLS